MKQRVSDTDVNKFIKNGATDYYTSMMIAMDLQDARKENAEMKEKLQERKSGGK